MAWWPKQIGVKETNGETRTYLVVQSVAKKLADRLS